MRRPYPWKCAKCRERRIQPVTLDYTVEMEHDGRAYTVAVPRLDILKCENCGNQLLPDEAHVKVIDALRREANLLLPEEIRRHRMSLGLTQEQLAQHLRVAKATVSRWETGGQIQQRAMDLLLRLFFEVPAVRQKLGWAAPSVDGATFAEAPVQPTLP